MPQELDAIVTAATSRPFLAGLVAGLVGVLLARTSGRLAPGAGIALGVAAAGLHVGGLDAVAAAGLVVAALAGVLAPDGPEVRGLDQPLAGTLLGVAGGAVLAWAAFGGTSLVVVAVAAVAVGLALPPPASGAESWRDTVLWVLTAAGVWAAVPDATNALVVLGAVVAAPVGGRLRDGAPHVPAALLVVAASGGVSRLASLVGVLGAIGVLWLPGRWSRPLPVVVVLHVAVVVVATRVAGVRQDLLLATVIAVAAIAVAAAVLGGRGSGTRRARGR